MFAENLLESSGLVRTSQRWTTLLSLTLEGFLIGLLILIPLLQNQGMPRLRWISSMTTQVPPPPRGVLNPGSKGGGGKGPSAITPVLMPPSTIPLHTDLSPDPQASSASEVGPGWPVGVPNGVEHSTGPLFDTPAVTPRPVAPPATRRPSIVTEGNVIYRVLPVYPPIAKQIGAQGPVVLHALIGTDGAVQNLRVVSSAHPTLNDAALAAVAQWRFRPYLLNGVAVEVEAQITVNFIMSH
jgi:protein TonB